MDFIIELVNIEIRVEVSFIHLISLTPKIMYLIQSQIVSSFTTTRFVPYTIARTVVFERCFECLI